MENGRGKRSKSKQIIISAAKNLFEEKGPGHVTFNDVAKKAQMCRTTIFNYFTSVNATQIGRASCRERV